MSRDHWSLYFSSPIDRFFTNEIFVLHQRSAASELFPFRMISVRLKRDSLNIELSLDRIIKM